VTVAVLPVVVHSLEGADHLRDGVADMLTSRLGRDPRLAVIRVGDPAAATGDPKSARETARAEGAAWVVFGSFTHFGKGASLDLQCVSVAQERAPPERVFVEAEALGDLIPKLDPLSQRIARHVLEGEPLAAPVTAPGAESGAGGPSRPEFDALRRRVDGLERRLEAGQTPPASEPAPPSVSEPNAER
jgi:TolB-like protein